MKLRKSVTSPIGERLDLADEVVAASGTRATRGTYAREAAEHFCPWYSNAPRMRAIRSTSGSALRVREHEVLAAGLADEPRVGPIAVDVLADRAATGGWNDAGRPGEVDAGQVGIGERDLGDRDAVTGDQVDDPGRQAGRLEQPHRLVRGKLLRRRRLPDDGVTHERRRRRQVAGDGGEVERRDGVDEALERPVVEPVPHAPARRWAAPRGAAARTAR